MRKNSGLMPIICTLGGVALLAFIFFFAVNNIGLVGFSKENPEENKLEYVWVNSVKNYKSEYSEYNTYTHYSRLNKSEKLVYRALEYALDNSFPYIMIQDKYIKDIKYTPEDILYLLSLDSPMVEQNLVKVTDSYTTTTNPPIDLFIKERKGSVIYVTNFTREKLSMKEKTISVGESIVNSMPKDITEKEKVEYIYEALGKRIDYITYKESQEKNYLYDALCGGESNCDGFANAFSLVCNMADIPCIEKMYVPEKDIGHTWNAFEIDGKWYNADLTAFDGVEDRYRPIYLHLGYSDDIQPYEHFYSEIVPECNSYLMEVSLYIDGGSFDETAMKVETALDESEGKPIVVVLGENMIASERFMNRIAARMGKDFYYYGAVGENKKLYCLYFRAR